MNTNDNMQTSSVSSRKKPLGSLVVIALVMVACVGGYSYGRQQVESDTNTKTALLQKQIDDLKAMKAKGATNGAVSFVGITQWGVKVPMVESNMTYAISTKPSDKKIEYVLFTVDEIKDVVPKKNCEALDSKKTLEIGMIRAPEGSQPKDALAINQVALYTNAGYDYYLYAVESKNNKDCLSSVSNDPTASQKYLELIDSMKDVQRI